MTARPLIVLDAMAVRTRPTGVASGSVELLRALAARDRGCDFVVVAGHRAAFDWLDGTPGWQVVAPPAARAVAREWHRGYTLPRLCRSRGAALMHALQPVAPWTAPCPVVLTVHDMAWRTMPDVIAEPRRTWLRAVVPPSLARASLLLANSNATATALAAGFPGLVRKVRVVPHGTPAWALAGPVASAPTEGERPFLLFVGTLEPRKNLPRLLDAYGQLLEGMGDQAPDLVLVGPMGWSSGPLQERLARPALRQRVRVRGWLEDDEVRSLYRRALAVVLPSLDEGFGLPVLEAMACGVPVLTSDRGAMSEAAGTDALLVNPLDTAGLARAMQRLATDPALRLKLASAGPRRASLWTWERTADLTAAAYAEITGDGGGRK